MARIAGVNIPSTKRIERALTSIYGVGLTTAQKILVQAKINPDARTKDLSDAEVNTLREIIEKTLKVEGDLKREVLLNVKRLKDIGSYVGIRHSRGLPVHGQRTKTNTRTIRGNVRRTMGSGRKAAAQKT